MTMAFISKSSHDGGWKRATGKMRSEIVSDQLAHGLSCLDGTGAMMGLQHDVLERQETRIDLGFVQEDIEACSLNATVLQCCDQRLFIDGRPARNIDQNAVGAEGFKHI